MKKNKNLLIILALAVCFIGLLIWNEKKVDGIEASGPKAQGTEKLQSMLDSLGKSTFDLSAYKALKSTIGASQMANVITEAEMTVLLASLEDKVTAAMVLSFDKWLSNNCGSLNGQINSLVALIKKQIANSAAPEAKKRIKIYSNFKYFLSNQSKLNQFLNGQYSDAFAQNLKINIERTFHEVGVRNCSEMSIKKTEWLNTISEFKKDHEAFEIFINDEGSVSDETCQKYKRYNFYSNQLINSGKCL